MKTPSLFHLGGTFLTSLALATSPVHSAEEPDRKEEKKENREENREEKREDRSERREDQKEHREEKAERREERKENREDKAERRDDRMENREDQAERREDRREDREARKFARFEDKDRTTVIKYFETHRDRDQGLPPGLVRRGKPLPPGWRDKVVTGYRIEDDWWPAFTPVSYDWFPNLRRDPDTALYFYGNVIVRVYEPRREVIDVIAVPTIRFDL